MTAASGPGYRLIAASILIAGVLIAVSFFLAVSPGSARTTTIIISGQSTTTITGSQTTGLFPVNMSASSDVWSLTAQINRTVVTSGQQVSFTFYLQNTNTQNESIQVANPLANPQIYTQQGKLVWTYQQSGSVALQQVAPGEKLYDQVIIPTSELQAGQTYIFTSSPNIYADTSPEATPIGQYLQVYATITVV